MESDKSTKGGVCVFEGTDFAGTERSGDWSII